jgi:hypothetical protein
VPPPGRTPSWGPPPPSWEPPLSLSPCLPGAREGPRPVAPPPERGKKPGPRPPHSLAGEPQGLTAALTHELFSRPPTCLPWARLRQAGVALTDLVLTKRTRVRHSKKKYICRRVRHFIAFFLPDTGIGSKMLGIIFGPIGGPCLAGVS